MLAFEFAEQSLGKKEVLVRHVGVACARRRLSKSHAIISL
jgi:hypothetical protein